MSDSTLDTTAGTRPASQPVHHCGDCDRKQPSTLAGYGYCRSAPTIETRARFVPDDQECWIAEPLRPRQRA